MSESSVFEDLKRELQEMSRSVTEVLDDATDDSSSRHELKRELEREAESTGRSLEQLVDDVRQRADENDRNVVEQLKEEFESFRTDDR